MLSEDIKKEIDKYNQDKKAQYKPTHSRWAKVHEQDHKESEHSSDHPEPELENQFHEDSYPMQDSDIEDLLESHTPYCQYGIHIPYLKTFCFILWISGRQGSQWWPSMS